ncbi:hypothetical protein BGZ83_002764, partial [Gryganskiella cystojenkinii]
STDTLAAQDTTAVGADIVASQKNKHRGGRKRTKTNRIEYLYAKDADGNPIIPPGRATQEQPGAAASSTTTTTTTRLVPSSPTHVGESDRNLRLPPGGNYRDQRHDGSDDSDNEAFQDFVGETHFVGMTASADSTNTNINTTAAASTASTPARVQLPHDHDPGDTQHGCSLPPVRPKIRSIMPPKKASDPDRYS